MSHDFDTLYYGYSRIQGTVNHLLIAQTISGRDVTAVLVPGSSAANGILMHPAVPLTTG